MSSRSSPSSPVNVPGVMVSESGFLSFCHPSGVISMTNSWRLGSPVKLRCIDGGYPPSIYRLKLKENTVNCPA